MENWASESLRECIDLLAKTGRNDLASDLDRLMQVSNLEQTEILRSAEADEIADMLVESDQLSDLLDALREMLRVFDVAHSTFTVSKEQRAEFYRTKVLTTYPGAWIGRYVQQNYHTIDPVVPVLRSSRHSFYWDTLDFSAPVCAAFKNDAVAHGVGPSGYSVPILAENGDIFGLSIASTLSSEEFRDRFDRMEQDFLTLAGYFGDAFWRLAAQSRPNDFSPNRDHLMVLRAIAMGAGEEDLRALPFEHGCLETVEASLCSVFQTKTTAQAAVIAARLDLLDLDAARETDVLTVSAKKEEPAVVTTTAAAYLQRWARQNSARVAVGGDVAAQAASLQAAGGGMQTGVRLVVD